MKLSVLASSAVSVLPGSKKLKNIKMTNKNNELPPINKYKNNHTFGTNLTLLRVFFLFGLLWGMLFENGMSIPINKYVDPNFGEPCQPEKLTVYKVILHTFWSRESFPKHYPDWRPPAQWSKVFGRSHDKSYILFRLGKKSSLGVKAFAETGRSDLLEQQSQGDGGVYDEFNAPPIASGVGRTEAEFFVDGNHSKVSLMTKIVPSPDWFIGIDSFDLCVNGNWLDSITIEVDPIDAGTDNGFTFTAPNWPTDPQGEAYRITAQYPGHPAGSFFYPYWKRLPPIATFQFIKIKEYELSEVFHHAEDDRKYDVLKMEHLPHSNSNNNVNSVAIDNNDIQIAIEEERQEQDIHQRISKPKPRPRINNNNSNNKRLMEYEKYMLSTPHTVSSTSSFGYNNDDNTLSNTVHPNFIPITSPAVFPAVVPRGDKEAILNSIADSYMNQNKDKTQHKKYKKFKKNTRKFRPPRDCRVTTWSEWSQCSKSCGIGEMQRKREVVKHARRGGRLCPPLVETKWCGSARSCNKEYFNWKTA